MTTDVQEIRKQKDELLEMQKDIQDKMDRLAYLESSLQNQDKDLKEVSSLIDKKVQNFMDGESFVKFFKKPYVLWKRSNQRAFLFVPKFVRNFEAGWLYKEEETFFIYEINQYSSFLGDVPPELKEELDLKQEFDIVVEGDKIFFNPHEKSKVKEKLGKHLKELGENEARILRGHEFSIIVDIIESGNLPFKARPVSKEDLREGKSKIELRDYQKEAYNKFMELGAIGLFHPTGAGKSFVTLKIFDEVKGRKLLRVPSKSLVEQWTYLIDTYLPHIKEEIDIKTYQARIEDQEYDLVVYDECHRLPANTFSKLALIKSKYRIGLSASPHREDGRESYIFALTGYPIGLNWKKYMDEVKRKYHPINVYVVSNLNQKIKTLEALLNTNKKTLIFCDSITLGEEISQRLKVPFIHGKSIDRIKTIQDNKVCVVSRVIDMGISIKNLNRIIEVDFLFGSRQQELQRTGRLMHSGEKDLRHDIIFTEKELEDYGKRLWSLQEKGFTINVIENKLR